MWSDWEVVQTSATCTPVYSSVLINTMSPPRRLSTRSRSSGGSRGLGTARTTCATCAAVTSPFDAVQEIALRIADATFAARRVALLGAGSTAVASDSPHVRAWDQNISARSRGPATSSSTSSPTSAVFRPSSAAPRGLGQLAGAVWAGRWSPEIARGPFLAGAEFQERPGRGRGPGRTG
jgi:hypothetical protein